MTKRRNHRLATVLLASGLLAASAMSVAAAGPLARDVSGTVGRAPDLGRSVEYRVNRARPQRSAPGANGRIVFSRAPHNGTPNAILTMTSDGLDITRITPDAGDFGDVSPAYSPGGTLIAFVRDMVAGNDKIDGDIWVIGADGTGLKRLTSTSSNDSAPDWTPDGTRLVFSSERTGNSEIYSMKADGTDVRRLTTNKAFDGDPSVSPDGETIVFASDRFGTDLDLFTMNVDGSGVTSVSQINGDEYQPDWSPDGTKIAFTLVLTGNPELPLQPDIYSINANGSDYRNLTADATAGDSDPSWSPDGARIAYWRKTGVDGDFLAGISPTGTMKTIIGSFGTYDQRQPDWQPIPAFPLVDARFSTFKSDIEWVFNKGITKGCTAERYCPNDAVTREQMAIFLDRALKLPATATDYFSDDTGRTGEAAINRVAAAGITSGCASGKYCPTDKVTRGAMASFLARAFALPATSTDYFTDDNGTTHEANINRVKAAGITSGCTPTTYCPTADVTRGQMAAFLRRALE